MTIRAGTVDEINWKDGSWVFVDLGFAKAENTSCGVLIGDAEPQEVCFGKACKLVQKYIEKIDDAPVNLVLEAPLSVAFDSGGNPKGRGIEARNGEHRYWYEQSGLRVMVAAQYMIKRIRQATKGKKLLLFEGFVSFKQEKKTDHSKDVLLLRDIVQNPDLPGSCIVSKEKLTTDLNPSDKLYSAFKVQGWDYGVPPVLIPRSSREGT